MTDWFEQLRAWVAPSDDEPIDPKLIARAAAIIMLEMAATDEQRDDSELAVIHRAMQDAFGIDEAELDELIRDAEVLRRESVSLHDFTRDLKAHLDRDERAQLVEWLWRVAWADGRVDRYEEQLLRRLADLLAVPHPEFIRRKHLAAEAAGISP
ncbi:tellurite resistance TerB family protein [Wenzhouxiangella sp. EGI_FJ10305]|uniref:tellurite resistance TerB family protein n=1 Tax=Wenzhouxiangella sp. EGI_FJ10305 TaxID=3243768 RepID=UPI0035D6928F